MDIEEIKLKCKQYINETWSFKISKKEIYRIGSKVNYNSVIRENLPKKPIHGVYIWSDTNSGEILYVGMSGQIKKVDGVYNNCGYDIQKRLVSSRRKDDNGKDITTSDFIKSKMIKENIESLTFTIIQSKDKVSPTYLESYILQSIYTNTDYLPSWNNSF